MPFVSERSRSVPRSAIREMFALQTGMEDVVSFALGEPDFTAPQHVIDATVASFQRGETHYTPNSGIPALREAISESYLKRGFDYRPNEIVVGAGAISVLCLACMAILDAGDEALLPDPGWANYKGLITQVGAVPVPVRLKEENGFVYDADDLRNAITPKTKLIMINFPSNPTGAIASAGRLRQIAALAEEKGLYILTDEIYRGLLWDDEPYTSIASLPGMRERTVIVDGFSKMYAMTGFRLAWGAGPEGIIAEMTKLLENVLSSVNEGVQWGGVAALTGEQDCAEEMKRHYRRRRKLIVEGLNAIPGISCMMPKGAFYAFANITKTGLKSKDFAIRLLKEKRVTVIPGTGFGEGGEGFVRLSYATSEESIQKGLLRMREFVGNL